MGLLEKELHQDLGVEALNLGGKGGQPKVDTDHILPEKEQQKVDTDHILLGKEQQKEVIYLTLLEKELHQDLGVEALNLGGKEGQPSANQELHQVLEVEPLNKEGQPNEELELHQDLALQNMYGKY